MTPACPFLVPETPDFRYRPIAGPEEVGDGGRIQWVSGRPGEAPAYAGTDFIIARNGRIAAVSRMIRPSPAQANYALESNFADNVAPSRPNLEFEILLTVRVLGVSRASVIRLLRARKRA